MSLPTVLAAELPRLLSSLLLRLLSAADAAGLSGPLGEALTPLQVPWLSGLAKLPRLVAVCPAAGVAPDGPGPDWAPE